MLRATVNVPSGCMFLAGPEVLCGPILHAHEARGPCLTTVVEMFVEGFYEFQVSDQQQLQDAANKQAAEMLKFPSFDPALAKGSPSMFYGAGVSLLTSPTGREMMACLAVMRGPKLGRGYPRLMPRQQAKAKILAMSPEERAEMAYQFWAGLNSRKEADVKLEEFEAEERRLRVKYSDLPDGEKRACSEATEFADGKAKKRRAGKSKVRGEGGRSKRGGSGCGGSGRLGGAGKQQAGWAWRSERDDIARLRQKRRPPTPPPPSLRSVAAPPPLPTL